MNTISTYGSWKSPITSDLIVSGTVGLGQIAMDGEDIYWVEARPSEAGRNVIVRRTPDGKISDVTPQPFNVRTRVHEYGGASFVVASSVVYFSHFADGRIYYQKLDSQPLALTPVVNCRYADGIVDKQRNRLICVREDHTRESEVVNTIVSINLNNGEDIQILTQGEDFYASPRLSPDGSQISWISWNHPNMPWDGTELWIAKIQPDGYLGDKYLVAGGREESIFQPEWSPDGVLYFVYDKSNWWNFYRTPLNPPLVRGEARIEDSPLVRPEAGIEDSSLVRGEAGIEDSSLVRGEARIEDSPLVRGEARIEDSPLVRGEAGIEDSPLVRPEAGIEDSPLVRPEAGIEDSPLVRGEAGIEDSPLVGGEAGIEDSPLVGGEAGIEDSPLVRGEAGIEDSPLVGGEINTEPPLVRGEINTEPPLVRGAGGIEPLYEMAAEFGLPQWVFGMSTYAVVSEHKIICTYTQQGKWYLATIDLVTKQLSKIDTPYSDISSLKAQGEKVVFLAGSPTESSAIVQLDLGTSQLEVLRLASNLSLDAGYLSVPESIEFPTENGLTAFGFFYPPKNQDFAAPTGEKPPLIVKSHGGPTAATSSSMNLKIQYWTSRGFAVLDVNYGGSTGYGREYRNRLQDSWGIVDVDDCANGAKYLAQRGLVDSAKMAIAGGSAGGYTTLCALTFRDVFKAGASYYGVSDLSALATDTHKFESRYLDGLIGPYPEKKDLYLERSPIHAAANLSCPIIFFQGLEDKVVPPNQAEMMVEILKAKGLPVAYVAYEGEQHGFRRAENIKKTLDGELYFYSQVFKFELAESVAPVLIYNL
ncbi:S9 family peptidase [Microcoleus anatoxicus]|uniref:S9 family peptidase n=1 Tax=Microcoleus anatoxicus TaxID=2705319 RepID=UPI0030C91EA3